MKEEMDSVNASSDFDDELDAEVSDLLDDAQRRADANSRKTVQACDL